MIASVPLAEKIRPKKLSEFIGQKHLVGLNKPLSLVIKKKQVFSMIFWGPPGCGKTTLARIIAKKTDLDFFAFSAVSAGKNDLRKVIQSIKQGLYSKGSIVFLDEIHRFNKAQQDYLLPYVENGTITLIGATTENPSFRIISPLLSRCRVFVLKELSALAINKIIDKTLLSLDFAGVKTKNKAKIKINSKTKKWLVNLASGDARQVINLIDNAFHLFSVKIKKEKKISLDVFKTTLQSPYLRYDQAGEEHYAAISAFIKSMRASDIDAALYYLARMISAGEDPLFIARRMVIFASEDIGMALPTALVVANEVFRACETIGYPECAINLAHGTVYLTSASKDRSSYNALRSAQKDVEVYGNLSIPLHLRNPVTKLMGKVGYGKGYEMYPKKNKSLLPDKIKSRRYYFPKERK